MLENVIRNFYFEQGIILSPDNLQKLEYWDNISFINGNNSKFLNTLQKFLPDITPHKLSIRTPPFFDFKLSKQRNTKNYYSKFI